MNRLDGIVHGTLQIRFSLKSENILENQDFILVNIKRFAESNCVSELFVYFEKKWSIAILDCVTL